MIDISFDFGYMGIIIVNIYLGILLLIQNNKYLISILFNLFAKFIY